MKKILLTAVFALAAIAGASAQSIPEKCAAAHGSSGLVFNSCLQACTCSKNCPDAACKNKCATDAKYSGTCQ